jgi:hypothetical protein
MMSPTPSYVGVVQSRSRLPLCEAYWCVSALLAGLNPVTLLPDAVLTKLL